MLRVHNNNNNKFVLRGIIRNYTYSEVLIDKYECSNSERHKYLNLSNMLCKYSTCPCHALFNTSLSYSNTYIVATNVDVC